MSTTDQTAAGIGEFALGLGVVVGWLFVRRGDEGGIGENSKWCIRNQQRERAVCGLGPGRWAGAGLACLGTLGRGNFERAGDLALSVGG